MWFELASLAVDVVLGVLGVLIFAKLIHAETFVAEKFEISDRNASDIVLAIYRAGRIAEGNITDFDLYNDLLRSFRSIVQFASNTSAPKLNGAFRSYAEKELIENEAMLRGYVASNALDAGGGRSEVSASFYTYKAKMLEFAGTISSPDVRSKTNRKVKDTFDAARSSFLELGELLNADDIAKRSSKINDHDLTHSTGVPLFGIFSTRSKRSKLYW